MGNDKGSSPVHQGVHAGLHQGNRLGMGGSDFLFLTVGCHNQSELDLLPPSYTDWQAVFPPFTLL